MALAYVGLGANLGAREKTLHSALEMLGDEPGVEVVGVSAFRETEPVGVVEQPRFVNAAAALETEIGARKLLDVLLDLERRLGRVRGGMRWGPRVVDLDLLLYGDEMWMSRASASRIRTCTSDASLSSLSRTSIQGLRFPGTARSRRSWLI